MRDLNRLELVGRALQAALDTLAEVAPLWLRGWVALEWYTRYGQPLTEFRLPQKPAEREALVIQIGWDGISLLEQVYFDPATPLEVRHLPAVEILRQIGLQQYVLMEG